MSEFITARFPEGEMPRTQDRAAMRRRVRGFIRDGEKGRLREAGRPANWGPWRKQEDLIERVLQRVDKMGVGPKLIIQRQNDMGQLSIREVSSTIDLGANPRIEESHALTYSEFNNLRTGGVWLCRYIDGTKTVSKHGYVGTENGDVWHGGAEDTFVTEGGMDYLEEVARFKVSRARSGILSLTNVIVNRTIYSAPSFEPRTYGGAQHFHIHEDAPGGGPCTP